MNWDALGAITGTIALLITMFLEWNRITSNFRNALSSFGKTIDSIDTTYLYIIIVIISGVGSIGAFVLQQVSPINPILAFSMFLMFVVILSGINYLVVKFPMGINQNVIHPLTSITLGIVLIIIVGYSFTR